MSFPGALSAIRLSPFLPTEEARDDAGNSWQTMDADPYWRGSASTTKLTAAMLQDWEAFMLGAMQDRLAIEFVDPLFRLPKNYRSSGLPLGFDGIGSLADLTDPAAPVVSGLPLGLVLRRGDRLGVASGSNKSCHMVKADVTVASETAQTISVVPPILANVFEAGNDVVLVDPAIRLNIVPNSWSAPRQAMALPIGSFEVVEASPT